MINSLVSSVLFLIPLIGSVSSSFSSNKVNYEIPLNVLQFELAIYNFAKEMTPAYGMAKEMLQTSLDMAGNNNYNVPKLMNSTSGLYSVCEHQIILIIETIANVRGISPIGPSIDISSKNTESIFRALENIAIADHEYIQNLTRLAESSKDSKQNGHIFDLAKATTKIASSLGQLFAVFLDNSMAMKAKAERYTSALLLMLFSAENKYNEMASLIESIGMQRAAGKQNRLLNEKQSLQKVAKIYGELGTIFYAFEVIARSSIFDVVETIYTGTP